MSKEAKDFVLEELLGGSVATNDYANPVADESANHTKNVDPQLGFSVLLGDLRFSPYLLPLDFISNPKNIAYEIDILDAIVLMSYYFSSPRAEKSGHYLTELLHTCFRLAQKDGKLRIENGVAYFDETDKVREEMISEMLVKNI
jgi:hypothetical protein